MIVIGIGLFAEAHQMNEIFSFHTATRSMLGAILAAHTALYATRRIPHLPVPT
jgi:hypothetical protein